ncbi:MAG: SPOR domain-containing protein [Clostridia bacterium]|nr:SPOR domain-containing protein [Clostridia bacterium]
MKRETGQRICKNAGEKLLSQGYNYRIKTGSGGTYAVQAGPYSSRSKAESVRDVLRKSYSGAFITER